MIEDDGTNPWRWIGTAKVGQPSEVIVGDALGPMHIKTPVVLLEDGHWYAIEPPRQLSIRPVAWRYEMIEEDKDE
jgi:hypothetical protein